MLKYLRMKLILMIVLAPSFAWGQVNTTCHTYGSTTNCTTTDTGAVQAERDRENYQTGQQIGAAVGNLIYAARVRHAVEKQDEVNLVYCVQNPNGSIGVRGVSTSCQRAVASAKAFCTVHTGYKACKLLGEDDRANVVAQHWINKHSQYSQTPANAQLFVGYMEVNNLSPLKNDSYDKAFKALRKDGSLALNK